MLAPLADIFTLERSEEFLSLPNSPCKPWCPRFAYVRGTITWGRNTRRSSTLVFRFWFEIQPSSTEAELCCGASSTHVSVRERREHGAPSTARSKAASGKERHQRRADSSPSQRALRVRNDKRFCDPYPVKLAVSFAAPMLSCSDNPGRSSS